jgi:hypothetical protein
MNAYPNVPCEVRILPNFIYQINNYKQTSVNFRIPTYYQYNRFSINIRHRQEESLSLTPPQIRQIAQKTLEILLPEKSKSQNEN